MWNRANTKVHHRHGVHWQDELIDDLIQGETTLDVSLPRYSKRRAICRSPQRSQLAAVDPADSSPPAAGGWGIPGSRCVYSLGYVRVQIDGGMEVAAASFWFLVQEFVPSGGGARWSVAAELQCLSRSRVSGSATCGCPRPVPVWWRSRMESSSKMVVWSGAISAFEGVGPLGPVSGDFPVARGMSPIQSLKGSSSSNGAPPTRPPRRCCQASVGLGCNVFFLWIFL
jgi:hypothetical protein